MIGGFNINLKFTNHKLEGFSKSKIKLLVCLLVRLGHIQRLV